MASTLDVVNECLASLGEAPLNTLTEPHAFKATALRQLGYSNSRVQAPGWWFNTEELTLSPAPTTGHMQLPGDVLKWSSGVRASTLSRSQPKPWLVQRGSRLYDTRNRTYVMTEDVTGEIVRLIPFEDLPVVVSDYVRADCVLKFQSAFDGDNGRRQELTGAWQVARLAANAENIRQGAVNFLNNNTRLQRIKSVTRAARY